MKAKLLCVLSILWLLLLTNASAFYDPGLQRWINRDPIQEEGGMNLMRFANNDPVAVIDAFGLECWIVQSTEGCGHQWFIGQIPDVSYWQTDLMPKSSGGVRTPNWKWLPDGLRNVPFHCRAEPTTPQKSGFDPNKLGDDVKLMERIQCSKAVDQKIKDYVADTFKESPFWNAAANNCKDYTAELKRVTQRLIRRDKIEQDQKKSKSANP